MKKLIYILIVILLSATVDISAINFKESSSIILSEITQDTINWKQIAEEQSKVSDSLENKEK